MIGFGRVLAFCSLLGAAANLHAGRPEPPPNLVLITLDTTRADHLGAWGWKWAETPNLDALAAHGARFARCDTAAVMTLPSHSTILTGLFPPRHHVRDNGIFSLSPNVQTVTQRLAGKGYDTAAIVSAVVLARRYGLDRGFRIYDDDFGSGGAGGDEVYERTADRTTDAALTALSSLRPPFFLWVHYYDPHEEYRPPAFWVDRIKGPHRLYDGEIAFMDHEIGRLLAALPKGAFVLAVGDHGEMLGEHGEATHGLLLYSGARRVPLILAGPTVKAGTLVSSVVRTADVAPTLLALAGLPAEALDGRSLLPLIDGHETPRLSYCESFMPFFSYRWYPLRAVSDERWLYLQAPKPSLYSLASDTPEGKDLAGEEPGLAASWQKRLGRLLLEMGESLEPEVWGTASLNEEQRRKLASLGYLGGGGGGRVSSALPDPRDMTDVDQALQNVGRLLARRSFGEALPELEKILRRDPSNHYALNMAGSCLAESGQVERALSLFQTAEKLNPLSAVPVANSAGCLLKLGRRSEAEAAYRRALKLDPAVRPAASKLARLLRDKGALDEALRILSASIEAGGRYPESFLERGVVLAALGENVKAFADFQEWKRRSPADADTLEHFANAAARLGRFKESASAFEELLLLSPGRGEVWKKLGTIYLDHLKDRPAARRCFQSALPLEKDPAERRQLASLVEELER